MADRGRAMRREHEIWLTYALTGQLPRVPRIPVRESRLGGFSAMIRTAGGRFWALNWWADWFRNAPRV